MIKLKVNNLFSESYSKSLAYFASQKDLPVRISWPLADVLDTVQKESKKANELQKNILLKYGKEDRKTGEVSVDFKTLPEKKVISCKAELDELNNFEFELPIEKKFKVPNSCKLSSIDIVNLWDMIEPAFDLTEDEEIDSKK